MKNRNAKLDKAIEDNKSNKELGQILEETKEYISQLETDIDYKLKVKGLLSVEDILTKEQPLDKFKVHAGMKNLDTFQEYLFMKLKEINYFKADYGILKNPQVYSMKGQEDNLHDFLLGKASAYQDIYLNFMKAQGIKQ